MSSKYYYMAVSSDELEIPIFIEDSARELALKLDVDVHTIHSSIHLNKSGKYLGRKIIKVKKI